MKWNFFNTLFTKSAFGFFIICASITSSQASEPNVSIRTTAAPKSCQWVGKVSIDNMRTSKDSMQTAAQHKLLETEAFGILKNQAIKLGANTIVLHENQMLEEHIHIRHQHSIEVGHYFAGDAYRCRRR